VKEDSENGENENGERHVENELSVEETDYDSTDEYIGK